MADATVLVTASDCLYEVSGTILVHKIFQAVSSLNNTTYSSTVSNFKPTVTSPLDSSSGPHSPASFAVQFVGLFIVTFSSYPNKEGLS